MKNKKIQNYKRLSIIFRHMKNRCYNKYANNYERYGGRGIFICDEWLKNEKLFYDWANNNGYSSNLIIDRIDNNKEYSPDNCRWVTLKEQSRNRRNNKFITYNNETHCIAEWSEITGLSQCCISQRLNKYHWSIEKTLNCPLMINQYVYKKKKEVI